MRKRKVKPNTFEDRAIAEVIVKHGGKIDLKELWKREEDKELDPKFLDKPIVNKVRV
jgi:hypothetical protein